jgi:carboxyl-terminal processing protease
MGKWMVVGGIVWSLGLLAYADEPARPAQPAEPAETARPAESAEPAQPTEPTLAEQAALHYADSLMDILKQVALRYMRPVSLQELARAAFDGLLLAAEQPPLDEHAGRKLARASPQQLHETAVRLYLQCKLGSPRDGRDPQALVASLSHLHTVLDPYCVLVPTDPAERYLAPELQDQRYGVGFDLEMPNEKRPVLVGVSIHSVLPPTRSIRLAPQGPYRIAQVVPGGPAQKAGLRPGDVLTHVNEQALTAANAEELFAPWRNELLDPARRQRPTPLTLDLERAGRKLRVQLTACEYAVDTVFGLCRTPEEDWDYWLDPAQKIAYVRLGNLATRTPRELMQVLLRLQREGMRGLVLDLRWCPGGYLDAAVDVVRLFLREGAIVSVQYPNPRAAPSRGNARHDADNGARMGALFANLPLVVLVNDQTTGGGEIIAAALQDHNRAVIVGTRTTGKASIQSLMPLGATLPDLHLKISEGLFIRPSGRNLQRYSTSGPGDDWGVRPDLGWRVPLTPALSQHLQRCWLMQSLRPGSSREALPLDDLTIDPQLRMALRALAVAGSGR